MTARLIKMPDDFDKDVRDVFPNKLTLLLKLKPALINDEPREVFVALTAAEHKGKDVLQGASFYYDEQGLAFLEIKQIFEQSCKLFSEIQQSTPKQVFQQAVFEGSGIVTSVPQLRITTI